MPKRVVATWFEATRDEQVAVLELVDEVKAQVDAAFQAHGYGIGINAGVAAGRTVRHLVVHVISRYSGDLGDPRCGVRHMMLGKGSRLAAGFEPAAPRGSVHTTAGHADPFLHDLPPIFRTPADIAILAVFAQGRRSRNWSHLSWLPPSAARGFE